MRSVQWLRLRPVLATGFGIACIVFVLLAVPFTYMRVAGFEVGLTISTPGLSQDMLKKVGGELRKAVQADGMTLAIEGDAAKLIAHVPAERGRRATEAAARAFAASLAPHGVDAEASVSPVLEKASTNLVAYASGRLVEIRIERDGKTADQIAEEIRSQLMGAGFGDAEVHVTENGEEMQIQMMMQCEGDEAAACEGIETRITVDGEEPAGQAAKVQIRKDSDRPMTDDELRDEVVRQLREQGVEADVVVRDGKIESITRH